MVRTVHHMAHCIRCVGIYNVLSACVCSYVGIHIVHETYSGLMNLDIYCRLNGAVMRVRTLYSKLYSPTKTWLFIQL